MKHHVLTGCIAVVLCGVILAGCSTSVSTSPPSTPSTTSMSSSAPAVIAPTSTGGSDTPAQAGSVTQQTASGTSDVGSEAAPRGSAAPIAVQEATLNKDFPLPPGATADAASSDTADGFYVDIKVMNGPQAITFWNSHLTAAGYTVASTEKDMIEFSGPGCSDGTLDLVMDTGVTLECAAR